MGGVKTGSCVLWFGAVPVPFMVVIKKHSAQWTSEIRCVLKKLQSFQPYKNQWSPCPNNMKSLSPRCVYILSEGAHALVSHPSLPPPLPSAPTGGSLPLLCVFTSLKEVMWRYLLSLKKQKTCLHQLNSLAHTDLKLTAISGLVT